MAKKKGKGRKDKQKQLEEKYNEKVIVDVSFEDLVKLSLGIHPKPALKKEDKEKGSE
ncbi:hypothetical protein [Pedobacter sp. UBA4863]|uniref:hypothetical protein n=1 Tax=Pedobacter sp. UBA4863 TaxID=1947060 RepID=UPI0025F53CAB|nr:hypothetical protein [Pedobacter sp. UBA4863]